ncbi:MAG: ribonuclease P protein component [Kiritimatiellae bacterium]|nr:ribonuclease P protein component [Kiritimatiellia bacterium]
MDHAEQLEQREQANQPPDTKPIPRQTLSRAQRITQSGEIREAYAQGHKAVGSCMVLWTRAGGNAQLRLGVVASRKVGNAVARARAKRLLREVYRTHRAGLAGHVDVVLVARHAILRAPWNDVVQDFRSLAVRAHLRETREARGDPSA